MVFYTWIDYKFTFPSFNECKKKDEDLYNKRIQGLYKLIIWISIIFIIPLVLLSDILIDFLYGDAYVEATNVLVIHIWSGIFVFLGLVSEKWLIVENLQKISLYNTAVGVLINITLNFLLINKIGINGAAWATLASYAFSQYFMLLIWNKTRKIFFIQTKGFILINGFNIKNFN